MGTLEMRILEAKEEERQQEIDLYYKGNELEYWVDQIGYNPF